MVQMRLRLGSKSSESDQYIERPNEFMEPEKDFPGKSCRPFGDGFLTVASTTQKV